jgi:two-component system LytT family response regulator
MKPIRTVVVDDEPLAREDLARLLARDPELEVTATCADGDQAVRAVREQRPELLFLDVQMPGLTGFDVLARLPAGARPHVVFVTAYGEYALQAFEVGAVDYLSKPFTRKRLAETLRRAKEAVRAGQSRELWSRVDEVVAELRRLRPADVPAPAAAGAASGGDAATGAAGPDADRDGRLLFRFDGEIYVCAPADIRWIETVGDYLKIHLPDKARLVRMTLVGLMAKLDPRTFVRIHRSTVVNLKHVRKFTPSLYGEYNVELHDGTRLKVSRTYMPDVRAAL